MDHFKNMIMQAPIRKYFRTNLFGFGKIPVWTFTSHKEVTPVRSVSKHIGR